MSDEKFARLLELKADWDSYGAPPIDNATLWKAHEWLASVSVVPCSDGGVQLEWHSEGVDVEITFSADGTTETYSDTVGDRRVRAGDQPQP